MLTVRSYNSRIRYVIQFAKIPWHHQGRSKDPTKILVQLPVPECWAGQSIAGTLEQTFTLGRPVKRCIARVHSKGRTLFTPCNAVLAKAKNLVHHSVLHAFILGDFQSCGLNPVRSMRFRSRSRRLFCSRTLLVLNILDIPSHTTTPKHILR